MKTCQVAKITSERFVSAFEKWQNGKMESEEGGSRGRPRCASYIVEPIKPKMVNILSTSSGSMDTAEHLVIKMLQ